MTVRTAFLPNCVRVAPSHSGVICHNGKEKGYLYIVDEPVMVGKDAVPHPRTAMDPNAEFLTQRPLRVKMICELELPAAGRDE